MFIGMAECPGCKKKMRKRDMKTECYDAKDRPSEYYHEYSCIDCCTLVSTFNKKEDAIKDIVEAWSSKSLNSEKLSSLYKERSEVSSKYNSAGRSVEQAAYNVSDTKDSIFAASDNPSYQTAIAAQAQADTDHSKAFYDALRNQKEILMEIGRIEQKIFCSICCEFQPLRSPTAKDSGAFFCSVCDNQIDSEYNSYQQTKRDGIKETTGQNISSTSGEGDPIKALKLRFAKGEITKKQFLEMKDMLE